MLQNSRSDFRSRPVFSRDEPQTNGAPSLRETASKIEPLRAHRAAREPSAWRQLCLAAGAVARHRARPGDIHRPDGVDRREAGRRTDRRCPRALRFARQSGDQTRRIAPNSRQGAAAGGCAPRPAAPVSIAQAGEDDRTKTASRHVARPGAGDDRRHSTGSDPIYRADSENSREEGAGQVRNLGKALPCAGRTYSERGRSKGVSECAWRGISGRCGKSDVPGT